ncbi:TetR/AcrR family transcriptional regulator [Cognatishimia activa]|uniref:TetR/AcrR family transcriptional regulator n=1 Tax=Cognatishimia activa TaxID=1715691 RepID=UPI0022315A53|nr:TetR/AcrR family transcriptional regulator [Cognatishimia activa]UZD90266.1 TetR/AcrR family transcriptional regulator [Cognatishimia activa]
MIRKRLNTETAILEAAFEIFGKNPGASLSDVAELAGVGRATLHRHFAGRDELIRALARNAMDELDAAVDEAVKGAPSYTEGLRLALEAMLPLASRQMFLATEAAAQTGDIAERIQSDFDELVRDVKKAQAEGGLRKEVPAEWFARAYENLIYAGWEMVRNEEATSKQAADFAWGLLSEGAKA